MEGEAGDFPLHRQRACPVRAAPARTRSGLFGRLWVELLRLRRTGGSSRSRLLSSRLRSFRPQNEGTPLPRTGFIDHIGIGVPDLVATKEYYDALMSVLGLREWFETGPGGPLNYGPDGARGSQLFFYQAEPDTYSRLHTGLHHLAFLVVSRAVVREAHQWALAREAIILDEPGEFPQYGEHCFATYWLDPHGFKLEAVCHTPEES